MNVNLTKRILIFLTGLFIMSFAVALSVKAKLGVSPISCIPYILSSRYDLTMGQMTIIFNAGLILLQILLLRKNYQLFQLIQFPVVIIFGFFTDFSLSLVSSLEISGYPWRLLLCMASCALLAFGVFLEVKAKITYLAGEGVAMALVQTFRIEFGKAKIGTDSSMVIIGALCSLLFFHQLRGAREGTIIAALLVGFIVRFYGKYIHLLDNLDRKAESDSLQGEEQESGEKVIITISREYGSGGHEIGKRIAERLAIPFYDKDIIHMTSRDSGYSEAYIQEHEQKLSHSLLFELYEQNYAYVNEQKPPLDALFLVQSKVIRNISEKTSCVIVGRCANFILKDIPGVTNAFIHSGREFREKRIRENRDTYRGDSDVSLEHRDHERERYCRHFTGKEWKNAENYDLTLDSSRLGIEGCARTIVSAASARAAGPNSLRKF